MAARRQASARYREKNLEEERDKARMRMARLRERINEQEELVEDFRERARQASAKHAGTIAHHHRILRLEAYKKKHGHHAWLERRQQLEARRAEAQEREDMKRYEEEFQTLAAEMACREKEVAVHM
ncbi:hypothetical protein DFH06DRAFT_1317080 [Mycena polygramma]|nr:hypothetical protein DFH06DRAFT_1317080 [Mycena polygramma]